MNWSIVREQSDTPVIAVPTGRQARECNDRSNLEIAAPHITGTRNDG